MEPKDLLSPERLYEIAAEIHAVLKIRMVGDDPAAYVTRANELVSWMANTGKMLADARYHRDKAVKSSTMNLLKDGNLIKLPASTINELIKGENASLNYLCNWIEQLDKEVKHNLDLLRTLISYAKTELANTYAAQ